MSAEGTLAAGSEVTKVSKFIVIKKIFHFMYLFSLNFIFSLKLRISFKLISFYFSYYDFIILKISFQGETARMSSFVGAIAIADMVKTTLGPKGMDKILQSVGDPNNRRITITNGKFF